MLIFKISRPKKLNFQNFTAKKLLIFLCVGKWLYFPLCLGNFFGKLPKIADDEKLKVFCRAAVFLRCCASYTSAQCYATIVYILSKQIN